MVRHEAISMIDPAIPFGYMPKGVEKCFSIPVLDKNRVFIIPAGSHMINGTRIFNSKGTGHTEPIPDNYLIRDKIDLTVCRVYHQTNRLK
ncbi:MAG TPA: hypothetical protein VK564_07625, partial [Thermodesulfobacteriota bacterium]|nr:hypothetical protein [Thermodesulfobacteriota bacterium]